MNLVGILGGTFDPVHNGHLRAALALHEMLGIAQVRLIPCARPPHRQTPVLSAEQRVTLLQKAVHGTPWLQVDTRELAMDGPSYTVNTLHSLRRELPSASLCLALGADALLDFHRWHRWREIPDLCHLVVLERPGWSIDQRLSELDPVLREVIASGRVDDIAGLASAPVGKVLMLPIPALDIAASAIRRMIAAGHSPRWLVPDIIVDDIIHLYSTEEKE